MTFSAFKSLLLLATVPLALAQCDFDLRNTEANATICVDAESKALLSFSYELSGCTNQYACLDSFNVILRGNDTVYTCIVHGGAVNNIIEVQCDVEVNDLVEGPYTVLLNTGHQIVASEFQLNTTCDFSTQTSTTVTSEHSIDSIYTSSSTTTTYSRSKEATSATTSVTISGPTDISTVSIKPMSVESEFVLSASTTSNTVLVPTTSNTVSVPTTSNTVSVPTTSNTVSVPTTSNTMSVPTTSNTVSVQTASLSGANNTSASASIANAEAPTITGLKTYTGDAAKSRIQVSALFAFIVLTGAAILGEM